MSEQHTAPEGTKSKRGKADGQDAPGLREKWSPEVTRHGWTALPNLVLEFQARLDLTPADLNILLHLVRYWRKTGDHPFPSKATLADRMGIDEATVRRRVKRMEDLGYVKRVPRHLGRRGQTSNAYDLSGLVARLKDLAAEARERKELHEEEDHEMKTKPARRVVRPKP